MAKIAEDASVSENCEIAESVAVGKGAIIEGGVALGENCEIGAYAYLWEGARFGKNNRVFPFCSLGGEPQDKKYQGEKTSLIVGEGNTFREYCFVNRGTKGGGGETKIGNGNLLMAYSHIAHDCIVGDDTVVANAAQIAGHVAIGDCAIIGGGALVQQFSRIGEGAMIGGGEKIRQDIPPFSRCAGGVVGINGVGLKRSGASEEEIKLLRRAFRVLYRGGLPLAEAAKQIKTMAAENKTKQLSALSAFLSLPDLNLIRPARGG